METSINRHLWLLTGRCNDFVSPILNTGISYGDAVPSEGVVEARKLLHLGDTATDYYVIGAMAALASSRPDAGADTSTLFLPRSLHVSAPTIAGGGLRPAGPNHPAMLHRPDSLPVARRWYVTKTSDELVRISTDTGFARTVPFRMADGVVYLDWPEEVGFHAAFAPDGEVWNDGSQVIICTEPSGYPYSAVAKDIRQSVSLIRLMASEGNLSDFHAAQGSIQKVGALVASVVQWGAKANRP